MPEPACAPLWGVVAHACPPSACARNHRRVTLWRRYSLQARHSYKAEDIALEGKFAPCVGKGTAGECIIDFNAFNGVIRDPNPTGFRVQSHS